MRGGRGGGAWGRRSAAWDRFSLHSSAYRCAGPLIGSWQGRVPPLARREQVPRRRDVIWTELGGGRDDACPLGVPEKVSFVSAVTSGQAGRHLGDCRRWRDPPPSVERVAVSANGNRCRAHANWSDGPPRRRVMKWRRFRSRSIYWT